MKRNPFRRKLDRLAGRYALFFFLGSVKILPENLAYLFSRGIGKLAFVLVRKYRRLAINNLTYAFKNEKSANEIKKIAKEVFCQIAWGATEIFLLALDKDVPQKLKEDIAIEGEEYLKEALSKKKGLICVSAHFGNFAIMTSRLAIEGYPFNMVVRDVDDPAVTKLFQDVRAKIGCNSITARPRRRAVAESLKWLRRGEALCLLADQNQTMGVYVDFLGRPAGTVEGPARLSLRTGAPVLCVFIVRLSRRKHKIIIRPPLNIKLTEDERNNIHEITKAYTKIIEEFVRKYPEQWWWVHNRWKGIERLKDKGYQNAQI